MFKIILCLCFLVMLTTVNGHQNKRQSAADMETALMPQELNPAFIPDKDTFLAGWAPVYLNKKYLLATPQKRHQDAPWQVVMPMPRTRRSNPEVAAAVITEPDSPSITTNVKQYSRILACIVLALSATIEIVVYIIEMYQVANP